MQAALSKNVAQPGPQGDLSHAAFSFGVAQIAIPTGRAIELAKDMQMEPDAQVAATPKRTARRLLPGVGSAATPPGGLLGSQVPNPRLAIASGLAGR